MMSDPKKINSPFDLNNMDMDQIIQALTQYRSAVLKFVVILGALLVAGMIWNGYNRQQQSVRAQMSLGQQKLDMITSRQVAIKNLEDFKASFPKGINEDSIITQITTYATANGVSIGSLSPEESQNMGLYDVTRFTLNGAARDYKAMVLFLRDMEKSAYLFKVDSWEGHGEGEVEFSMKMSVLHFH